jgi:thioredoxin reductase (NADPH)
MMKQTSIALIGAGPLGIELAVGLRQAGLDYVHLEAGQVGSTMQWWAPHTRWFSSNERISIAGVPLVTAHQEKATREEYLAYLRSVVEQFGLAIETYRMATRIEPDPSGGFRISTRSALDIGGAEEVLHARKVILATGGTATPNRLDIPGEDLPHVSHYFRDPHTYFQKNLLIVGGRNSAVEAALRCFRAGARVHFSYRGAGVDARDIKYWLYPEFSGLVKAGKIQGHLGTCPAEITPQGVRLIPSGALAGVEEGVLPIDFVLLLTGYLADMSLPRMAGVALSGDQLLPAFNPETMETNVPGIYIAGTAIAGTQRRYRVFLENCHVHVAKIVAHLQGRAAPASGPVAVFERPES